MLDQKTENIFQTPQGTLQGTKGHPCNYQEACCHKWTGLLNNDLSLVMKVMKIATGVGRNWIDYGQLQKTLTDSNVSE